MKNIFILIFNLLLLLQSCDTKKPNTTESNLGTHLVDTEKPLEEIDSSDIKSSEDGFLYDMSCVKLLPPSFESKLNWISNIKKGDYSSPDYAKIMVHRNDESVFYTMEEALKKPLEVKTLFLIIQDLKELPKEIEKLQNLERLALESANFTNFAKDVERLSKIPNLKTLQLKGCKLKTLPKNINLLKNLEIIYLGFNPIQSLPNEFCELENLLLIQLYNVSSLKELPSNLGNLKNLEFLGIAGTSIKTFPESIENCDNLLCITANAAQIKELPDTFGGLENLHSLNLSYNYKIEKLPASFVNLKHLTRFYLDDNLLQTLPSDFDKLQNLTHINLNGNRFTTFPIDLSKLSNLMQVDIMRNEISHIPYEIAKTRCLDIIMYEPFGIRQSNIDSIKQLNPSLHLYSDFLQRDFINVKKYYFKLEKVYFLLEIFTTLESQNQIDLEGLCSNRRVITRNANEKPKGR